MAITDDAMFRAFMDACPLPVFLKSDDLRYVYANPPMLALVGMREEQLPGQSVYDVFPGSARALAESERRVLETGEPAIEEQTLRLPDGSRRRFRDTKFRVPFAGAMMVGVFRVDITEPTRHQFELSQVERLSAVGRLAAGIAHDYNKSLQSVLAYADLLQASPDRASAQEAAARIRDEVEYSAELTRSLMQFVREVPADTITTDVNGTIEAQLALLRRTLSPSVILRWMPADDLPALVFEPVKMGQVLTNLCINASDAMEGQGVVHVETHLVPPGDLAEWVGDLERVPCPQMEHIAIVVRDEGPGMDEKTVAQVMQPFFTTKESGTGLGLSTVNDVARQYDGLVEVMSSPGRGAEFRVLLPVGDDAAID